MSVTDVDAPPDTAASGSDPTPLVCVVGNLTEAGVFGRRWLVVRDGEARVYGAPGTWPDTVPLRDPGSTTPPWDGRSLLLAAEPPLDAELLHSLPVSDVRDAHVEPLVGAAVLIVDTADGAAVPLIRFTPDLNADFGLAARVLVALSQAEPPSIDPRDVPAYCPHCGRRLRPGMRVCWNCIDRGAVIRRLLSYALPYKFRMLAVSGLMIVGVGAALIPAQINRRMINVVLAPPPGAPQLPLHARLDLLPVLVGGLLLVSVVQRLLSIAAGRLGNVFGSKVIGDIRAQLWGSIQRLSLSYFDKAQIGNLMARVSQDTSRMQTFLTGTAQQFIVQALRFCGVLGVMFAMNWELTLVLLIPAPVVVLVSRTLWPLVRRLDRRLWQTVAKLNVVVNDALTGIRVVKAFGQEDREVVRFGTVNEEWVDRNIIVSNMWTLFGPTFSFVTGFGTLLVWYVGGTFVLHRRMDLGTLLAFASYLGMVIQPLTWSTGLIRQVTTSVTSSERVFEVMDAEPDVQEATEPVSLPHIAGHVRFEQVEFGYTSHLPVLRDIDLDVQAGEMIGLVGHSGAGKSTLVNLLCRLYDVRVGRITVDGVDLRRIPHDDLRRQIGVVLQDTFLFDGTIAENIAYARPDADLWAVMEAAKAANAHDFICAKPEGYDSVVGARGQRLSGGERQRIAIARAILHDPRILILDEATASVDSETEQLIQQAIARLVQGRTTFAIAHRLSTLRSARRLAVFDQGRIVELGTHEELMAREEGHYRRLVEAQQESMAQQEVMVG